MELFLLFLMLDNNNNIQLNFGSYRLQKLNQLSVSFFIDYVSSFYSKCPKENALRLIARGTNGYEYIQSASDPYLCWLLIELEHAHKITKFQNFKIKSASTQYCRNSKWLCRS